MATLFQLNFHRECSLLYKSKGKDHLLSTSQKAGLAGLYKKFLFLSSTAISKPVLQEVDGTVILPLTFIKEWAFPDFQLVFKPFVCLIWNDVYTSWSGVDPTKLFFLCFFFFVVKLGHFAINNFFLYVTKMQAYQQQTEKFFVSEEKKVW